MGPLFFSTLTTSQGAPHIFFDETTWGSEGMSEPPVDGDRER
jgi:hypothetical protein